MTPQETFNVVQQHCFVNGKVSARRLQESYLRNIGVYEEIQRLSFLLNCNFNGVVDWMQNGFQAVPTCSVCNHRTLHWQHTRGKQGWSLACSNKCTQRHPSMKSQIRAVIPQIDQQQKLERRKKTNLEKYGVEFLLQIPKIAKEASRKANETRTTKYGDDWAQQQFQRVSAEHGGVHPLISKRTFTSSHEHKVANALQLQFPSVAILQNDRSVLGGKEIDIWIPERNLGIEVNGWWWHRESGPNKSRQKKNHLYTKQVMGLDRNVFILNFWDFEVKDRFSQIINLISSKINCDRKIGARKTTAQPISTITAEDFINANHIQDANRRIIQNAYGLFVNRFELVAVMTFGKHPRQGKSDELVLNRFCSLPNVSVIGGASKLLQFAQNDLQFSSVISWSDNRFSQGVLYSKMGFELEEELKPDYQYIHLKSGELKFKSSFLKDKTHATVNQTEYSKALEMGWDRLWDCGKKRWRKTWN